MPRLHAGRHIERHRSHVGGWLRAAVLGANDGVVSTASLVLGVAAADGSAAMVATAGLAALVGGALSMAVGEYVSVGSQLDVERADLERERQELAAQPEAEHEELVRLYADKGLPMPLAREVAEALAARDDLLAIHAREELGLDPEALARPTQAAAVSAISFALGAALPLAAISLSPLDARVGLTLGSALLALASLGAWSARLGGAPVGRAVWRVAIGGAAAMSLTWLLGAAFGAVI